MPQNQELKDYTSPRVFDGVRPLSRPAVERIRARRRILEKYHARIDRDREVTETARLLRIYLVASGVISLPLMALALLSVFAK